MKKVLILMVMLMGFFLVSSQAALAAEEASATSHVFAQVNPNVSLSGMAHVDAGTVQTGDFTAECVFRVDANTQQIKIWAEASDLWKGNDPNYEGNDAVAPIPLNRAVPVDVYVTHGSPLGTAASALAYNGGENGNGDINGFPTYVTQQLGLESSQNNHFSQDVILTFTWNQDDPQKPRGEYSGFVKMSAMVMP